ncbi:sphingosine 1-phosphate receptor 5b isoform X1 [Denticeps clupeoides]|uniref:G-protein coupled receptors family 1 profile domain-containing protein n=1 Tax=Denticeps clupeoides TaxID=299321 RepID=A0AAY3ZUM7_9TELE|nr:sphingosine 1-phosphate receptor 1-like isoform X1 [Denticeps clupeoides]XP_028829338.1 sphingosine 1-phosphate receptor 1-like isoform X1 [Denticeps clupeoides]
MVEKRNLQHACRCHSDHEPNAVNSDYPGPFYRTMESSHASYIAQPSTGTPITPSTAFLCRYLQYQNNSVILQHYNYVGKLKQDKYEKGLKPEAIALLLVCLLIVLENSVVLVAIWKNKKFHLPMYYLLGNLTFSDLLAGFTYMLNIMLSGPMTLRLTPLLWFLREGGVYITLTASIISLLAIAIERHVTMAQMKPYQGTKRGRMFALIATSWALPVLLGVLPIMGWNCIGNLKQCSTILPLYNKSYILFCVIVFSSILVAIIVLYCRIYLVVKTSTKKLGGKLRKGATARRSQKNMVLLKTVTIVLGVFIICWLPLFGLLVLDFMSTAKAHPVLLKADYFLGLAMINSLLNPVIYTLTSKDMRRAILRLLCQRCLMTQDGQMKAFGISFLECSFSKSVVASHRLQGLETTISSGNITHSHIKAIYPKLFVNKL